ncbi:hypothetical protein M885DRAFT_440720 [Pelagophyceae sp. CCMP2097]|nr:hypothetical protein M885DRAFT_440720 [Pelagophyceae sp. CCMP2097]
MSKGNAGVKGWDDNFALYSCAGSCGSCFLQKLAEVEEDLETDYYVKATKDTVVWGYFDQDAKPLVTIQSGETLTMEVLTHHCTHDYAKMIRGDTAAEEVYYWKKGDAIEKKAVPKFGQSGVHLITGPVEVQGAEPGDVVQVDILALDPRKNPVSGKTYGTNSAKFAGYHFRVPEADGTMSVRTGGDEVVTVFEFVETPSGKMGWGKPVYMYTYPTVTDAGGTTRTFDGMPGIVIPHVMNYDYGLEPMAGDTDPVFYPEGFDGTTVESDGLGNAGVINYLDAELDWKVPLRPHLGILAVMPANSDNYLFGKSDDTIAGANTIPPSAFGGNVDDWRIGKGATMYYKVQIAGAMLVVGDTHAAQGDSELAGTAVETSMTAKLRVTLHKAAALPKLVATINFPLLENDDVYVIHGFSYANYLTDLDTPSDVFAVGGSVDLALADCFAKTRTFLMDTQGVSEPEAIALMGTGCEFGITQIVDGNWGVHALVPKWLFLDVDSTPYDYKCTSNPLGTRRLADYDDAAATASYSKIVGAGPVLESLKVKLTDAKISAKASLGAPLGVASKVLAGLEAKGSVIKEEAKVLAGL